MSHGGDIYKNKVKYDFSVSINPYGVPEKVKRSLSDAVNHVSEYPDIDQIQIRKRLSELEDVSMECIVPANGASELINVITKMLGPRKVLVLSPCFSGYKTAVQVLDKCEIKEYCLLPENNYEVKEDICDFITSDIDLFFLCNPNNPTGKAIGEKLLTQILNKCEKENVSLILDACYEDLSERDRINSRYLTDKYKGLFIVKAFTKTLAIPGVRFGYLMTAYENAKKIRMSMPEWNLSVFAQSAAIAGCDVLRESDYINKSRELISSEVKYVSDHLRSLGIRVYQTDSLFLLFYIEEKKEKLWDYLIKKEILIRKCDDFEGLGEGFYRIAVKTHGENELLMSMIKDYVKQ